MWGAASFVFRCARCSGTPVRVRGGRPSRRCPYRVAVPPEGGGAPPALGGRRAAPVAPQLGWVRGPPPRPLSGLCGRGGGSGGGPLVPWRCLLSAKGGGGAAWQSWPRGPAIGQGVAPFPRPPLPRTGSSRRPSLGPLIPRPLSRGAGRPGVAVRVSGQWLAGCGAAGFPPRLCLRTPCRGRWRVAFLGQATKRASLASCCPWGAWPPIPLRFAPTRLLWARSARRPGAQAWAHLFFAAPI